MKEREREYGIEIALSRIRGIFSFGNLGHICVERHGARRNLPPIIFFCVA
ncbi:MAG: hypothetical protein ABII71_02155 [Candidatus Micrarchaeota archaeon]